MSRVLRTELWKPVAGNSQSSQAATVPSQDPGIVVVDGALYEDTLVMV